MMLRVTRRQVVFIAHRSLATTKKTINLALRVVEDADRVRRQ